jgi:UDP-N-acetylmuramoylalanine--D-glutamate ligase
MMITNIINQESNGVACGDCGFPISQAALDYKLYKYFVVELSSFQLKGICKFAPKIAVITNINQAHLDYHESIDDYHNSKYKITMNHSIDDYLVLNLDDEKSMSLFSESKAIKIKYSLHNKMADCYIKGKWFYFKNKKVCKLNSLKNKTDIMFYNALASICVGKLLNIKNANISNGLKSFTNIKYRLQKVKKNIFNDAKSTNVYSTICALKEFKNKNIFLICGGYDRGDDLTPIISNVENVKCVYTYGMTSEKVCNFFSNLNIKVYSFTTLKEATLKALNDQKIEVILYSPMFASYDQYKSFEERGIEFNKIINNYYKIV